MKYSDGGSLENKGLFWGRPIFGFCVSVVDPSLLEMEVRHSRILEEFQKGGHRSVCGLGNC